MTQTAGKSKLVETAYGMSPSAKPVTKAELIQMALDTAKKGARPISFTSVTDAKSGYSKTPFGKTIWKVGQINSHINIDLEKHENKKREQAGLEADYKPGARAWGEHETSGVIKKDDKYYIAVSITSGRSPVFVADDGSGNMSVVTTEQLSTYKKPDYNKMEANYKNYSFDSIIGGVIDTVEFVVSDADPKRVAAAKLAIQESVNS